jgi:hypothetical protein
MQLTVFQPNGSGGGTGYVIFHEGDIMGATVSHRHEITPMEARAVILWLEKIAY